MEETVKYFKTNPCKFVEEVLGIKLTWYQKLLLRQNATRSIAKSNRTDYRFVMSVIECLLNPNHTVFHFDTNNESDCVYRFENGSKIVFAKNITNGNHMSELKEEE